VAVTFQRRVYQAAWVAQKRADQRAATQAAAARDALDRCPTCGVPWPEDVPADQLTPCEDQ